MAEGDESGSVAIRPVGRPRLIQDNHAIALQRAWSTPVASRTGRGAGTLASVGRDLGNGGQMSVDERIERSRLLYEQALFESDAGALTAAERELDGVEADLALARGRVIHGRFLEQRAEDPEQAREDPRELALFERAAQLYRALGDVRGEAESLFWVGCCHQLVRRDNEAAVPLLWRSLELATEADDPLTMSEALATIKSIGGSYRGLAHPIDAPIEDTKPSSINVLKILDNDTLISYYCVCRMEQSHAPQEETRWVRLSASI